MKDYKVIAESGWIHCAYGSIYDYQKDSVWASTVGRINRSDCDLSLFVGEDRYEINSSASLDFENWSQELIDKVYSYDFANKCAIHVKKLLEEYVSLAKTNRLDYDTKIVVNKYGQPFVIKNGEVI